MNFYHSLIFCCGTTRQNCNEASTLGTCVLRAELAPGIARVNFTTRLSFVAVQHARTVTTSWCSCRREGGEGLSERATIFQSRSLRVAHAVPVRAASHQVEPCTSPSSRGTESFRTGSYRLGARVVLLAAAHADTRTPLPFDRSSSCGSARLLTPADC